MATIAKHDKDCACWRCDSGCFDRAHSDASAPRVVKVQLTAEEQAKWGWDGIVFQHCHYPLADLLVAGVAVLNELVAGQWRSLDDTVVSINADSGVCKEHKRDRTGRYVVKDGETVKCFTRRNLRIEFDNPPDGLPNLLIVRGIEMGEGAANEIGCRECEIRIRFPSKEKATRLDDLCICCGGNPQSTFTPVSTPAGSGLVIATIAQEQPDPIATGVSCYRCTATIRVPAGCTLETNLCVDCGGALPVDAQGGHVLPSKTTEAILAAHKVHANLIAAAKEIELKHLAAASDRTIQASQRKQTNANLRGVFG